MLSIITYQLVDPYVPVVLSVLSHEEYGTATLPQTEDSYKINLIKVSPVYHASSVPYTVALLLATRDETSPHDQMAISSDLLSGSQPDQSVVLGGGQNSSAVVSVRDPPNLTLPWLLAAYEAAFETAELVREDFIGIIQLKPLD